MKIKDIKVHPNRDSSRRSPWGAMRLYIWPEGETILENLRNRHERPYTTYKKLLVPKVLKRLGITQTVKSRWSSTCGCSCPCSPGFFVEVVHPVYGRDGAPTGFHNKDVHVTITA